MAETTLSDLKTGARVNLETGELASDRIKFPTPKGYAIDDVVQTAQDQLHQTTDATERQMQELMNWAHEWLTSYERIMGHGKKTTAKKTK